MQPAACRFVSAGGSLTTTPSRVRAPSHLVFRFVSCQTHEIACASGLTHSTRSEKYIDCIGASLLCNRQHSFSCVSQGRLFSGETTASFVHSTRSGDDQIHQSFMVKPVLLTEKELLVGIGDRWEYISVVAEDKPCALENLPRNVTRGNCPASGLVTNGAQCEPACQTRLFGHKESRCANGLLKWQGVCDDAPCAHNPCLHGGECGEFDHDGQKQSQCACTAGWTGPTCNSRDYCSDPGLCKHGSTCDNGNPLYPLSYFCDCFRTGYTGRHCDQPVCRHNGLYLAGQGKYTNNLPLREMYIKYSVTDCL